MHLVLVHGYLLSGSGSNTYTSNVARTWKSMGHAVTVVCQEREAEKFDFVDEFFVGTDNIPLCQPAEHTVRVVVPDIDDILIVYNYNAYKGYTVKVLGNKDDCTIKEIDNYIAKTVSGLKKIFAQGVDRVLANHLLLSPVITKQACNGAKVPYDVKIHGSAITFGLKQRTELMKYAIEGLSECSKIIVGSTYVANLLKEVLQYCPQSDTLVSKVATIPPGMNANIFKPLQGPSINAIKRFLDSTCSFITRKPNGRHASKILLPQDSSVIADLQGCLSKLCNLYDPFSVDSDILLKWPQIAEDEPIIVYFGALLHTKGVGELIVSFPQILERVPKARLLLIGYGGYRENIEGMLASLASGSIEDFISYAKAGDFVDCSSEQLGALFRKLSVRECERITVTGSLEHRQLCEILPVASVAIFPIKAPEAFGMVTIESMSCGVLPLITYQSGIRDVLDVVKGNDPETESIMHIEPQPGGKHGCVNGARLVEQIPQAVFRALEYLYPNGYLNQTKRIEVSKKLRNIAVKCFAWEKICTALIQ